MSASDDVEQVLYRDAPDALRRSFARLRHRAGLAPVPGEALPLLHDPALDAVSFYLSSGEAVVSYAAVLRTTIAHGGRRFRLAGLGSVATDPDVRGRGLGLRTVAAATRWIEASGADLGVFTCDPPLAGFYARAGGWPVAPKVVVIGSRDPGALRSDALGKVVLMRLFTEDALAARTTLTEGTLDLGLPVGQFL